MRAVCLLAVLAVLAACRGQYHVRLEPPRPGITPAERVAMFWKMRPTEESYVKADGQLVNRTIFLGDAKRTEDKIEVVSPEDLEPLVGSDSETMRYARASTVERHKANTIWYIGLATALAGGGVGIYALGHDSGAADLAALGGILVGGILMQYVAGHYTEKEIALRKEAFTSYTSDLGLRLNVCAHGSEVVPCEAPVDTPAEPPKPPATTIPGRTALLRMR